MLPNVCDSFSKMCWHLSPVGCLHITQWCFTFTSNFGGYRQHVHTMSFFLTWSLCLHIEFFLTSLCLHIPEGRVLEQKIGIMTWGRGLKETREPQNITSGWRLKRKQGRSAWMSRGKWQLQIETGWTLKQFANEAAYIAYWQQGTRDSWFCEKVEVWRGQETKSLHVK